METNYDNYGNLIIMETNIYTYVSLTYQNRNMNFLTRICDCRGSTAGHFYQKINKKLHKQSNLLVRDLQMAYLTIQDGRDSFNNSRVVL